MEHIQLSKPTKKKPLANEVQIEVSKTVERGFKTKTKYTRFGKNKFDIVPTKDIMFLSFQEHGRYVTKSGGYAVSVGKGVKGNVLATHIFSACRSRITTLVKGKNLTVGALRKKLFGRAGGSKALTNAKGMDIGMTNTDKLADTVVIDPAKEAGVISASSAVLFNFFLQAKGNEFLKTSNDVDPKEAKRVIDEVYNGLGVKISPSKDVKWKKQGNRKVLVDSWKSPIIPVSDEGGYEVFGSYQYGRGLEIIPQSGFDQLLKADKSRILSEGELDDLIDFFYKSRKSELKGKGIKTTEELGVSLARSVRDRLTPDEFNTLTTRIGLTIPEQGEGHDDAILRGLGNAIMADERDRAQVVTNVPTQLADLNRLTKETLVIVVETRAI